MEYSKVARYYVPICPNDNLLAMHKVFSKKISYIYLDSFHLKSKKKTRESTEIKEEIAFEMVELVFQENENIFLSSFSDFLLYLCVFFLYLCTLNNVNPNNRKFMIIGENYIVKVFRCADVIDFRVFVLSFEVKC